MTTLAVIYECILCDLLYYAYILICFYRRREYLYFCFMFSVIGDMFWTHDTWILMSIFFKICRDFFKFFWAFYIAFCAYRLRSIKDAVTNPSQCPPSRRPRPRLWTMDPCYLGRVPCRPHQKKGLDNVGFESWKETGYCRKLLKQFI